MVSGAIFAGLISVEALFPYAFEKWFGISGNWALLFAGRDADPDARPEPGRRRRRHLSQTTSAKAARRRRSAPPRPRTHRKGALMDRILTTHTGSLARPQAILDFLIAMERGERLRPGGVRARPHRRRRGRRPAPGGGGNRRSRRRRDGQAVVDHLPVRAHERDRAAHGRHRGRPRLSAEPRPDRVPGVLRRARPAAGGGDLRGDGHGHARGARGRRRARS